MHQQSIRSVHSSDITNFRVPPYPFFTMPNPKIFRQLLICVTLYKHAKNSQLLWFIIEIQSILESRDQIGHTLFFSTMPNENTFSQLLIFVNLYQHASNTAIWLAESILAYTSRITFFPNIGFLYHHHKIQRNLMIRFKENTLTGFRRERWTDTIS